LAKNNYAYEKRQRDLAKKKKKEEKKLRKISKTSDDPELISSEENPDIEASENEEVRID